MIVATETQAAGASVEGRAAVLYGTPLFYYSLAKLRTHIARLRQAMSGFPVRLLFATMANDRNEILRTIAGEGVGACVNSVPHLQRALECGFDPGNIQFTSCGLPVDDMTYLQVLGIPANLDSPSQVERWCSLRKNMVVGARINAAALTASKSPGDRIGMDIPSFEEACRIAESLGGRVNGVHVYAGTNFQAARDILPTIRALFDLVDCYPDLEYMNLGGGIGVDYAHSSDPFDYEVFGAEVCDLARRVASGRKQPLTLLFEPGRSMVASSALFLTRVTDVKMLLGTRFVVVDASVSLFPRSFYHPGTQHNAYVLNTGNGEVDQSADAPEPTISSVVVGRTTFSRDIFGTYNLPSSLKIGAFLAFEDAGAYCESMTSRFLGQREPVCYVAED
ncbi:MAG TPA: diaminopimelate decarboxylase [Candidatus Dormibacteraeota bacterium]|nr:diaminopimelate decarboxylase [Candidatus Dormibacteraeota bacterium]